LTATVTDSDGNSVSHTITVSFQPAPPIVQVISPEFDGQNVFTGLPIELIAKITNRPLVQNPCSLMTIGVVQTGTSMFSTSGSCTTFAPAQPMGDYDATATATDGQGTGTAMRPFTVFNKRELRLQITSPMRDDTLVAPIAAGKTVALSAAVAGGYPPYKLDWLAAPAGFTPAIVGTATVDSSGGTGTFNWTASSIPDCTTGPGIITALATDAHDAQETATISVALSGKCDPK
jgi:hypothetical protein